ncbi:hypothetical protein MRX96_058262 [Rhipicephalus microplus]
MVEAAGGKERGGAKKGTGANRAQPRCGPRRQSSPLSPRCEPHARLADAGRQWTNSGAALFHIPAIGDQEHTKGAGPERKTLVPFIRRWPMSSVRGTRARLHLVAPGGCAPLKITARTGEEPRPADDISAMSKPAPLRGFLARGPSSAEVRRGARRPRAPARFQATGSPKLPRQVAQTLAGRGRASRALQLALICRNPNHSS